MPKRKAEILRASVTARKGCFYRPSRLIPTGRFIARRIIRPVSFHQLPHATRQWKIPTNLSGLTGAVDGEPETPRNCAKLEAARLDERTNLLIAAALSAGRESRLAARRRVGKGFWTILKPSAKRAPLKRNLRISSEPAAPDAPGLDRTAKMYVGGKQARPRAAISQPVWSKRGRAAGVMRASATEGFGTRVEARAGGGRMGQDKAGPTRAQVLFTNSPRTSRPALENEFRRAHTAT